MGMYHLSPPALTHLLAPPSYDIQVCGLLLHAGTATIFFTFWHMMAFGELKTDCKSPVDQFNALDPFRVPHSCFLFCYVSLCSRVAYIRSHHIWRYMCTLMMNGPGFWSSSHHESGCSSVPSERRMVRVSFLLSSIFILPIWHYP